MKPFRFLNFWTKHKSFQEVVKASWGEDTVGSPFYIVQTKMKRIKSALSTRSKATFGKNFPENSHIRRFGENKGDLIGD